MHFICFEYLILESSYSIRYFICSGNFILEVLESFFQKTSRIDNLKTTFTKDKMTIKKNYGSKVRNYESTRRVTTRKLLNKK